MVVLNIGLMNEKVVFQKCSVVKDGIGNHRNEWTEDYCCFGRLTSEIINQCQPYTCSKNADIDSFFHDHT